MPIPMNAALQQRKPINRLAQLRETLDAKNDGRTYAPQGGQQPPRGPVRPPIADLGAKNGPTAPSAPTFDPSKQPPPGGFPVSADPGGLKSTEPTVAPPKSIGGGAATAGIQDPTTGDITQRGPASPDEEKPIDQREQDFITSLLSGAGNVNTADEEALLQQLFGDQMGQSLVDQRASMGRAGFGASGALGAMEGDVRRKAAQGQAQATFDLRRGAKQDAIDNALKGIGADVDLRKAATDDFLLKQILGLADDSGNADANGDGVTSDEEASNAIAAGGEPGDRAGAAKQEQIRREANISQENAAPTSNTVPPGASIVDDQYKASKDGYVLFQNPDGSYVWVKKGSGAGGGFSGQIPGASGGVRTS